MTALVMSDVHLRDAGSVKTQLVIRFLQEEASKFEHIYILGDLFDVWPGTTKFLIRTFQPVLQVFRNLVADGHTIHYLEGNHDFRLGEYFTESVGIRVYPDQITETWNGRKVFMAHGDLGNPKDKSYRALRAFLRHGTTQAFFNLFPGELVYRVGLRASGLSRGYQARIPSKEAIVRQIYRDAAETIFRRGYDVVLMGHTHIPDDVSSIVDGRECRYINTGDWLRNFTYLEFDGSQIYTRTHPVKTL